MAPEVEVDGRTLSVTNLDKALYPSGFTKGEAIDYYARIAPAILPHLEGKPLSIRRFPDGTAQEGFFEKRCPAHRPEWVQTATVWAGERAGEIDFCVCEDRATLVWLAQLAALELHPYLAPADDVEHPTVLAFDLDPGEGAGIAACCRVALEIREALAGLGLECVPKTSGGKGLQAYAALDGAAGYEETKAFARALAEVLAKRAPERITSSMAKERRGGRVFIDWSQNDRHKTTVAAYSLRARERPTVSTPLLWEEVEEAADADPDAVERALTFEAGEVLERVERHGDLFAAALGPGQKLPRLGER